MNNEKREALGYVFVGVSQRPFYSCREIRRGRNKGRYMCEYRKSATRFKKGIFNRKDLKFFTDEQEEFTMDSPCPKCGKWLFHSINGCY